jgi:hypothetical protein
MAVTLKQIMIGSMAAGGFTVNTAVPGTGKVQMIKNIRCVNKHASASVTLNVSAGPSGTERLVSPQNMSLGPGQMYQDDGEFILNSADLLKIVSGTAGGPVEYLISGIERDQS